jgi:simple sugar transport system permease protein
MRKLLGAVFGRTESALLAATVMTAIVFSLSSPYFLTFSNFVNLIEAYSVTTILAAGVFVVLVSGGIDVSFTATAAATQVCRCLSCRPARLSGRAGAHAGDDSRSGAGVHQCSAHILSARRLHHRHDCHFDLPDWWSGRITFLRFATASGVVKITLPVVVMAAVVLLTQYLMAWTRIGRQVYALGGNPEAASRVGVGVLRVQLLAYGYLGLLAAVAGFIQAGRVHQAVPTAMAGQELNVLAVAILGGASLVGGVGSVAGVVLAVLFLAMLQNGLNLVGVSSYFFGVVIGFAILISVSMTAYAESHGRKAFVARLA